MYERYKDRVEFLLIYIREAHPTDGWQHPLNEREKILLETARTAEQKEEHADICVRTLDIKFTTLIDDMEHPVESAYAAWPDRLYVVGKNGRIAWKGLPGPGGFRPEELERALEKQPQ